MNRFYKELDSPIGKLTLIANDDALIALQWKNQKLSAGCVEVASGHKVLDQAAQQLKEYFAGERKTFDLPLAPVGTEFQQKVWKALREIPFGTTQSYGSLARKLGSPNAARAVGAANGKNPIGIIVPCHRVIGANGSLTGFAGGLETKEQLLKHEGYPVPVTDASQRPVPGSYSVLHAL